MNWLFPEPKPCVCGCRHIHTVYVGGGYEGLLPFWVRMKCPVCGRKSQKKCSAPDSTGMEQREVLMTDKQN